MAGTQRDPHRPTPRNAAKRLGLSDWMVRRLCLLHPHVAERVEDGSGQAGWRWAIDMDALVKVAATHRRRRMPRRPPAERAARFQAVAHAPR